MLELNEIKALMSLLDDPDELVWKPASNALSEALFEQTEVLEEFLYQISDTPEFKSRLENCILAIRYKYYGDKLRTWKNEGGQNLIEALSYICQIKYPDVTEESLTEQLEALRLDAWLEFHYDLTSFEKVKILNYILFQLHGFRGDEETFLHPENSFINKVLENKKGNPISLSIVYMLVAQRLNVPVYGINLPRHFIMAYVEDDETAGLEHFNDKQVIGPEASGEIKFYINAYNGGGVFNHQHLQGILKEMELEEKPEYILPCRNTDIILRVLMNLYNSFSATAKEDAEMIDKVIVLYQN